MSTQPTTVVVDALVEEGLLDPDARERGIEVVTRALSQTGPTGPDRLPATPLRRDAGRALPQVVEVVAYLGGALVLAAGGLFLGLEWTDLGLAGRIVLLAVVAVVLAVGGGASARVPGGRGALREPANDIRRRLAGTLLTGSSLAVAFLVGLAVEDLTDITVGGVHWPAVVAAVTGTLAASMGYRVAHTALGVVAVMGGVLTVVTNLLSAYDGDGAVLLGVALVLVGALWAVLAELRTFEEAVVARMTGALVAVFGAQFPVIGDSAGVGYLLTALLAAVGVAAYLRTGAWPYLAAAVVSVTFVVPEAVADWTDGSLGAVGGVLVTGITLLLASFGGYRLSTERR